MVDLVQNMMHLNESIIRRPLLLYNESVSIVSKKNFIVEPEVSVYDFIFSRLHLDPGCLEEVLGNFCHIACFFSDCIPPFSTSVNHTSSSTP